jgi:hypothetical protein
MGGTYAVTIMLMMSLFWLSVLSLLLSVPVGLAGNHDLSRRMMELGFAVWCGILMAFVFLAVFVEQGGFQGFLGRLETFILVGPITLWRMGLAGPDYPAWYIQAVHLVIAAAGLAGSMTLFLSERRKA